MKFVITLLFIVFFFLGFSQNGFDVIRKAEKKIEKGQYAKALKLLDKADSMNYGFCGNAWIEAEELITVNRAEIYILLKEPIKAANCLNESYFMFTYNMDSLKTTYFAEAYGKELVKHEIDSCIASLHDSVIDDLTIFSEELQFNVTFSEQPFILNYQTVESLVRNLHQNYARYPESAKRELFEISISQQAFYKALE